MYLLLRPPFSLLSVLGADVEMQKKSELITSKKKFKNVRVTARKRGNKKKERVDLEVRC